jgi:HAD superfamily hydrolase (TIGR01450 family)
MDSLNYTTEMGIDTSEEFCDRLRNIRHVVLDMDGTIYNGSSLFPFTISFLENLKELGIGYSFLTNNSSKSIDDYLTQLKDMGIFATRGEMYTAAMASIEYLLQNYPKVKRLFILGTPSMISEFEAAGFESTKDDANDRPEAVVIGFDTTMSYSRLCRAAWWISKGLFYLATNPDRVCPTDESVILVDCGSICAALEHATGKAPDVVIGKPSPRMLDGIMKNHNLQPSQIAIVGDRIYTDLKMAHDAKILGVLVLSGETTLKIAEQADFQPDIIVGDLAEFGQILMDIRK